MPGSSKLHRLAHRPGVSRAAMAAMLAATLAVDPGAAFAGGFAGTPTVASGSATFNTSGNTQTVTIPTTSPQTIINWAPTDTATSTNPVIFLPQGSGVSYVGTAGANYTVLNRIIPTDAARVVEFDGTVVTTPNTNVWFYSPGGFLIGATATFDVGSLVLTAADPVVNNGSFVTTTAGTTSFSFAGASGSQSAITILHGAQIDAVDQGQSDYVVAIAPQINNAGNISVEGGAALVAAESASFAIDPQGLFNITVTSGTTVSSNTFTSTGSVGGPDSVIDGGNSVRRVYMVAVPKNNAVTMAISAGGNDSIGFAPAGAASMDGNVVVLSAGENIADTGTGNPTTGVAAGSGSATLTVTDSSFTSNTYAVATDSATFTSSLNLSFASDLTVLAPNTAVYAQSGSFSVGGDLVIDSDSSAVGGAGSALFEGSGAIVGVGTSAAMLGVNGDFTLSANDTLGGVGGTAQLVMYGGSLSVAGNLSVTADANWSGVGANNPGNNNTSGGTALVEAADGGSITVGGQIQLSASADATGAYQAITNEDIYDEEINANGGTAQVISTGSGSLISAGTGISVLANATGGSDPNDYPGGNAQGGTAYIDADSGGALQIGGTGSIMASADALAGDGTESSAGGTATGGTVSLIANYGTITMAGPDNIDLEATATGGVGTYDYPYGFGGSAFGGAALLEIEGGTAALSTNSSGSFGQGAALLNVSAQGGPSYFGSSGGPATGGTATISVTGGSTADFAGLPEVAVNADATGGQGGDLGGGQANGGTASLQVTNSSFSTSGGLYMSASATGGVETSGAGGNALGGTVLIGASQYANLVVSNGSSLAASATGGNSQFAPGGNATDGNVVVTADSTSYLGLDQNNVGITLDTSTTAGTGTNANGAPADGTTSIIGGGLFDFGQDFDLNDTLSMVGNTALVIKSAGNVNINGSITAPGDGAYLQLWADDTGTGFGNVYLADGSVNLSGAGAAVDIDYNPVAIGTPTDYSPGVAAGFLTSYQLIDNVNQLQEVGSYLDQNFALGRNIDASATQGWNVDPVTGVAAGFVPIGSSAAPFTGNFDGLGNTINALYINASGVSYAGLFGAVSGAGPAPALQAIIRNVGLTNADINGDGTVTSVGGLVGYAQDATLTNDYIGGAIAGYGNYAGGLVGETYDAAIVASHSDATVLGYDAGGLVGDAEGSVGSQISQSWATGAVTGSGQVGGLVGNLGVGTITQAYATGTVTGEGGGENVGGLVGFNGGSISQGYAVGTVNGGSDATAIGGLVGVNAGSISESYASGLVTASQAYAIGGLVGLNEEGAQITNSYWDSYSTTQSVGVGSGDMTNVTNLDAVTSDPDQEGAGNYAFNPFAYGNFGTNDWVYDNDNTRPLGAWEVPVSSFGVASIKSAHQLQLIDFNMGGNYKITQNLDLSGTEGTTDIWGPGGFMPLGGENVDPPFTGTLEGAGHVIFNLTMSAGYGFSDAGLIQDNQGTISDLGLSNVNVSSTNADYQYGTGAIAGQNEGVIFDSFATGIVTSASGSVGGLVGVNSGSITQAYATVAVSGGYSDGGLVGSNSGALNQVFANGSVTGSTAGGLVGTESVFGQGFGGGTITSGYWDTDLTGQSYGCSDGCAGTTGLTTDETMQSSYFGGFSIDTTGGQGMPWRQYNGNSTPLLEAFLTQLIVQPQSLTIVYDAAVPSVGVDTYGYGGNPALLGGTPTVTGPGQNAGSYAINYGGGLYSTQLGYDIVASSTPGTLIITPAPLTLAAVTDTKTYDATVSSSGQPTATGLQGDDYVTSLTQSFTSPNVMGTNGSTLVVNNGYFINDGNNGNNYTVTLQSAPGTINPALLTLAAVTDTKTYDATTSSFGQPQAIGLQGDDSASNLSQSFTSPNVMGANGSTLVVNNGYVISDGNGGNNYTVTLQSAPGTINPASLTLAAVTDTKTYDATTNSFGQPQAIGLQGDDSATNLSQSFTSPNVMGTNGSTLVVNNGYVISDGNNGANYTVTLQSAPGTINPALLTLAAVTDTKTYDATTNSFGQPQAIGLQGDDSASNLSQSFTSPNVMGTNGSTLVVNNGYVISDGNGGNNYTVTLQSAPGTINPALLTLAAVTDTKTYDATTNSFGQPQAIGLQGDDSASNLSQSFTSPNVMGTNGSTLVVNSGYVISDGNNGNNYTVTLQSAPGTINPALLTLAAVTDTKTYDATTNSFGQPQAIGLQGDDSATNLSQSFTSPNVMGTNGSTLVVNNGYVISDGNNGNNYTVTLQSAPGTINPALLTLAAVTDTKTYDATTNSFGQPQAIGLQGDDSASNLSQSFTSPNVMGTNGSTLVVNNGYVISDGNGGNNYTVTLQSAPGTINPALLTLAAVTDTKTYDATTNSFGQPQAIGLQGDDSASNLSQSFTSPNVMGAGYSTLVVNQGYVISDGNNGNNYTVTLQSAPGTINPALLTLAAVTDTKTYDATTNSFGQPQAIGLQGDDSATNLSQSFTSPNVMGTNGSTLVVNDGYVISDGNGGNNYTVTLQSAPGTINPASLTLAAVTDTKTYDATTNSFGQPQAIGLQGDDSASNLSQSFTSPNVMGTNGSTLVVNNGYVISDGNNGNNYTVTLQSAPGTINPASLTLAAVTDTKTYDATTNSFGQPQAIGLQGDDSASNLSQSFTSPNVMGTNGSTLVVNQGYVISDGNGGNNYTVTLQSAPGTINPALLTLAAVTDTKTYDATTNSFGQPQATGLQGDDSASNLSQSFTSPNVMGTNGSTLVVNQGYFINDGNGGNNYTVTLQSAPGTINPASLTLAAVTDSKTYDATTNSFGQPQAIGLQGDDSASNLSQSFTSPNVMGTNGSTLVVNQGYVISDGNGGNNYTVTLQSAPGTINPALLTLAAVTDTKTYDATTNSFGQPQATGLQGDDSASNLSQSFTSPNVMGTNGSTLVVNQGYFINDGNGGNNYTVTLQSAPGTINPASLTLAAVTDSKTYDATTNSFGQPQAIGLQGDDSASNLSQSFTSPNVMGTNGSTLVVNQGYVISDGNGGNNYTVTLQSAPGTINPASLTLAAVTDTKTYDATTNSFGQPQATGLQGDDSASNLSQSFTSPNVMGTNGSTLVVNNGYVISDGNGGNNYTVTLQSAPGTINPALLTLAAVTDTKTYDATTNSFGQPQAIGLQGDDSASNLTQSFTSPNVMGTNGSTLVVNNGYVISDGNNGNNYTVTLQSAPGTINPASLTLAAVTDTKTYDATTNSFGQPQAIGLQGDDSASNLSQSFTSPNVMGTNGSTLVVNNGYVISDGNNGNNYTVTLQSAPGTINPASLTLAAVTDTKTYDATTNSFGQPQAIGLQGDDSASNLSQSFTSPNVMGTNGSTLVVNNGYVISDGNGGNNYTVTLQSAPGTINPASLTLAAVTDTKTYDATTNSFGQPQAIGLQGDDSASNLSQSFTSPNVMGTNGSTLVVNYGYVISDGNGGNNYTVTLQSAPGTINPASLTLAAVTDTKTYDATTNSFGQPQAIGLQGDDSASNLSQSFTSPNVMGTNGSTLVVNNGYVISDGNGGNNYTVTLQSAPGTINPASLTLAAVTDTKTYDATTNSFGQPQAIGLQGDDSASNLSQSFTSPNVMGTNGSTLVVNNGYVISDGNGGNNYTVTLQSAPGTINPASLTLAAVTDTKTYDATTNSFGQPQAIGLQGDDSASNLSQSFTSPNVMGTNGSTLVVNNGYVISDGNNGNNYTVTLQSAPGTINPASLTVTYVAQSTSSIYGNAITSLSGSFTANGLQGEDSASSVLSNTATFATSATSQSNVGNYAVTGSGLTGASSNYTYSFVQAEGNGTALAITPRPIAIVADTETRLVGLANPPLLYSVYGPSTYATVPALVNGDQLTGSLATNATPSSPVGIYPITIGTLAASSNYSITYIGNYLSVGVPSDLIENTISSIDTSLPGSSGGDGSTNSDDRRRRILDGVAASVRGALLPPLVEPLINDTLVTRPSYVYDPVTINGNSTLWNFGAK